MNEAVVGAVEASLVALESSYGVPAAPASAQAFEWIELDMGSAEQGNTRPKADKTAFRGESNEFIEGRVEPIAWTGTTSVKSRATATTAAKESALYQAGGLTETIGGADVTYTVVNVPSTGTVGIYRAFGSGVNCYEAEQGFGGVVETLNWTWGAQELRLSASGKFAGKRHQGKVDAASAASTSSGLTTDVAADAYLVDLGYYQIEAEVVKVTAVNYATGAITADRAALGSVAAIHAAKPLYPYLPALTYAGRPIAEPQHSAVLDGVTLRVMEGSIDLETGRAHLPLDTSSKWASGFADGRVKVRGSLKLVLLREQVALLNKMKQRKSVAVTITCGTAAGGIFVFSMPTCELRPFNVPGTGPREVQVTVPFHARDNAGNDLFELTCS